jgi:hypothetical protein
MFGDTALSGLTNEWDRGATLRRGRGHFGIQPQQEALAAIVKYSEERGLRFFVQTETTLPNKTEGANLIALASIRARINYNEQIDNYCRRSHPASPPIAQCDLKPYSRWFTLWQASFRLCNQQSRPLFLLGGFVFLITRSSIHKTIPRMNLCCSAGARAA